MCSNIRVVMICWLKTNIEQTENIATEERGKTDLDVDTNVKN